MLGSEERHDPKPNRCGQIQLFLATKAKPLKTTYSSWPGSLNLKVQSFRESMENETFKAR